MENKPPYLTNVRQIRLLTPNEAQKGIPVKLHGVITYYDARSNDLFVQDATAGIYVVLNTNVCDRLAAGQSVEIAGITDVGDFAPVVKANAMRLT
ncbi:MAG: sensor histidine kinase, partial [Verrucomicrobiota bacterium]